MKLEELAKRFELSELDIEFSMPYTKFSKLIKHSKLPNEPNWLLAIKYFIEIRAAALRRWTDFMAIREFIQNALDEADRFNEKPEIRTEPNKLVISNPSKKLLPKHLKLGGSEKECWERGRYGEGLKVAAMHLLPRSQIYIYSHDNAYRFLTDGKDLYLLIGTIPNIGEKTRVEIYNPPRIDIKTMIYSEPTFVEATYKTPDCPVEKPSKIKKEPNKLYVRDIYVNTLKELTGFSSLYSYNLWWVTLSEDRTHVTSTDELLNAIATLIDNLSNTDREKLAKDLIDQTSTEQPYGLKINTSFLEYTLIESKPHTLALLIQDITRHLKSKGIQAWTNSKKEVEYAIRNNIKVIYSDRKVGDIPSLEEHLIKKEIAEAQKYEKGILSPQKLNSLLKTKEGRKIRINYAIYKVLSYFLATELEIFERPPPEIYYVVSTDEIIGMHKENKIIENINNLSTDSIEALSHCIHEITHHITGSPDETRKFERDLTRISSRIIHRVVEVKADAMCLETALEGLLLTPFITYTFKEVTRLRPSQYHDSSKRIYRSDIESLAIDIDRTVSPIYHIDGEIITRISLPADAREAYRVGDFRKAIEITVSEAEKYKKAEPLKKGKYVIITTQFKETFPLEPEIKIIEIPAEEIFG